MSAGKETIRGKYVTIHFDGARCVHSRNCVLGRPDVFVPNVRGEWIHPDNATPEEVAALAAACPSGAITYERHDGGGNEQPPLVNTVRVRENGPYAFHAPLTIAGTDEALRATLCRCGQSKNKPYCDGSHSASGFVATGEPPTVESPPSSERDGPVTVTPRSNGPLKVTGALEIVSGTGRTISRTTTAFLCRCGHSKNKPFCDGTHKTIGFTAP